MEKRTIVVKGGGVVNLIAGLISYSEWESMGWAVLHGIFGIFYLIYWLIFYAQW